MKYIGIIIFSLIFNISNINAYHISNNGKELIKQHETLSLKSYKDADGYSIGYGHHTKAVKRNQYISMAMANKYFNDDIKVAEQSVNNLIDKLPYKYNFSQGFYDGLCSLVYNCGEGGIRSSKFYKTLKCCRVANGKINKNDLKYTIALVRTTRISAKGHKKRREHEMKVMLR